MCALSNVITSSTLVQFGDVGRSIRGRGLVVHFYKVEYGPRRDPTSDLAAVNLRQALERGRLRGLCLSPAGPDAWSWCDPGMVCSSSSAACSLPDTVDSGASSVVNLVELAFARQKKCQDRNNQYPCRGQMLVGGTRWRRRLRTSIRTLDLHSHELFGRRTLQVDPMSISDVNPNSEEQLVSSPIWRLYWPTP